MTREEAANMLEKQFNESCGDYRYQNKDKLDYEDALWIAIAALREQDAQEKHEPLTIDELRQMDGEPVWAVLTVKTVGQKAGYALIYNNCKYATQRWVNIPLWYSEYGEIWIAYRHRIEEEM